ncbi:hypothetical protein DYL59_29335, partial [Pseudomonas kairouanensis]
MSSVAVVKSIVGQVFAVSPEGIRRLLVEGDRLLSGEQVDTGASGAVSLELADGRTIDLGRDTQWSANAPDSVTDLSAATAQAAPSVAELQQAIAAGADPTQDLEATAAGQTAAGAEGSAGGSHSFVVLEATAGVVDPTIGYPTTGLNAGDAVGTPLTAGDTDNGESTRAVTITLTATPTITEAGGVVVYTVFITQAPTSDLTVTLSNGLSVVIAAGQTSGALNVTYAGNDTPYLDASEISATITGTSGGGKLNITTDPAPAVTQIADTIDTTTVTLTATGSVDEGGKIVYTATVDNPAQTDVVIKLSNDTTITIAAGKSSGTVTVDAPANLADGKDLNVQVTITGADGGNYEKLVPNPEAATTTVLAVNDAPVITFDSTSFSEEKGDAVALVKNLTITDIDNTTFSKVVVTVDNLASGDLLSSADVLKALAVAGITITQTGSAADGKIVYTLTSNSPAGSSAADFIKVVEAITFQAPGNNPSGDARTVTIEVTDNGGENQARDPALSDSHSGTVDIVLFNDAPTASDATAGADEDHVATIVLSGADVDGNVTQFVITGLPENGKLYSDESLTTELKVGDSVAAGADGKASVYFSPTADWSGTTSVTFTAVDSGINGTDIKASAPATVDITIAPVTDTPHLSLGGGGTVTSINFDNAPINGAWGTVAVGDANNAAGGTPWLTGNADGQVEIGHSDVYGVETPGNSQVIELEKNAGDDASLYTIIKAESGTAYTISVDYSPRAGEENGSVIDVFWGGVKVGTLDTTVVGMKTYTFVVPVTADGDAKLEFKAPAGSTNNGAGGVLDNISVTQVLNTGLEDHAIKLSAIDAYATDKDGSETLKLEISGIPEGATISDGSGNSFTATAGNQSVDISGWNKSTLVYNPVPNANGLVNLTVTATAQDGTATPKIASITLPINVIAVNDAPVLGNGSTNNFGDTYIEGKPGGYVAANLTVSDVDNSTLQSAKVTLINHMTDDVLIADVTNSKITVSYDAQTGILSLSGEATKAEYQEVLRSVHFASTSEDPSPIDRKLTITVNDGQADSAPVNSTVYVVPENDKPVVSFENAVFTEQGGAVALVKNLSITDVDNTTFSKVVVTVDHLASGDLLSSADVLKALAVAGITITQTGTAADGKVIYTLTSDSSKGSSAADFTKIIDAITFQSPGNNLDGADRTVTIDVTDIGGGNLARDPALTGSATGKVAIDLVNDAPTASGTTTGANEDHVATIVLSGADVDGTVVKFVITALPENGKLYSDETLTTELKVGDSVAAGADGKASVYFSPTADWSGTTAVKFTAVDDGVTGANGSKPSESSAEATVVVTIAPVTDTPHLSLGGGGTVTSINFDSAPINGAWGTVAVGDANNAAGTTPSTPWLTGNADGQVEIGQSGTYGVETPGNSQVIELEKNAGDDSSLYTIIKAESGTAYTISVDYSPRAGAENDSVIDVFWGGVKVGTLDTTVVGMKTYTFVVPVTADGDAKLEFKAPTGDTNNSFGGVLDNISVTQVLNTGLEDHAIKLSAIDAYATDKDGSETLKLEISGIPDGATISDGSGNSFTATAGNQSVDISGWNKSTLVYNPVPNANGLVNLTVTATAQDGTATPKIESITLPINVIAVNDAPVLGNGSTNNFGDTYIEGKPGGYVAANLTVSDVDNSTLQSAKVTLINHMTDDVLIADVTNSKITVSYDAQTGIL